jgi:hypothetical protein
MFVLALLSAATLAGPAAPTAPPLVTLVTPPWSATSELRLGDRAVARVDHLPGAAVRGAMVPGTGQYLAVADTRPARDLSYAASLFVLAADVPARRLCDDVVHASRPLVAPDGRAFVVRGVPGPAPAGPALRTDFIRIDQIDLATGVARTVHAFTGQFLHLAGWHADRLLVYRVDADGADLVAIDAAPPHAVHPLADVPPFARDFSVDPQAARLVFHDRDDDDPDTWHIEQVDLTTDTPRRLADHVDPRAQPFAAAGSVWHTTADGALHTLTNPRLTGPCTATETAGCQDVLRRASPDGRWLAGLHVRPGALPRPFVLDTRTGEATLPPAPTAWVDLLGFAGGAP